ncbi:efflux RND transporter periplasmic adaptor subunit [Planctomyces sp. SH-PL14]|uniref:efflux RND transporter periplasmic adaptor subunit n=1 Tax=Planctomyces sp. SH-PL14 TaxID=1632864 RepID=UPI00078C1785|nr:efflux RND transporter periplasmic adaptor subunit [Planctomyces sp. SH-PL14]AMV19885.1 Efflux pump periplasmic linker BepF [Planctomyces sp. SH-PL14]
MPFRLLLGLLLVLPLCGCGKRNQPVQLTPPQVDWAYPLEKPIVETIEFTGTTRATARVELRAQVGGILEKIAFEDGATVKEGDLLFVIEQPPYQAKLQLAQATVQKAEAALKKADLAIQRVRKLFSQNAAPETDVENAEAARDTALADVSAAKAELKNAELQVGYTEIRAPITGRISRHLVDRGNLIQAQMTALATIESIAPIHAFFYVSERELLRVMELLRSKSIPDPSKIRPELFLGLINEKGFPRKGYLDYREFGVDTGTGTVLRRGVFDNEDHALIPGLFVRIQAPLGDPAPRLLVEERAVGTNQQGEFVLVIGPENKVELRLVQLGPSYDGLRVVKSGLGAQDKVIINGLQLAAPSRPVTPSDEKRMRTTAELESASKGSPAAPAAAKTDDKTPTKVPAEEQSKTPAAPPSPDSLDGPKTEGAAAPMEPAAEGERSNAPQTKEATSPATSTPPEGEGKT